MDQFTYAERAMRRPGSCEEARKDVSAAADALGAADMGDDDARFVVDGAEDHELLWFATQEIDTLLE
jgi:hypothetical protein